MTPAAPPDPTGAVELDPDGEPKLTPRVPLGGWLPGVFVAMAVAMVPWSVYLAITLPERYRSHNYDVAWSGFDAGLAVVLALTGIGLYRRSEWTQAAAVSAATFLLIDAWFDVMTSQPGRDRAGSVAAAALLEVPLAALCLLLAARLAGAEGLIRHIAGRAEHRRRLRESPTRNDDRTRP
ncbi:MAG: hypothetical protein KDC33_03490 [Thermoleophilia bacterium]|nr:hypothetical protein [Thermoleophilia bacterium]